jgi:homoaconitase/3-isopropylmalate dehydratase large subunit
MHIFCYILNKGEIIMNTDSETIRHGAFFVLGIGALVLALGVLSIFYVG